MNLSPPARSMIHLLLLVAALAAALWMSDGLERGSPILPRLLPQPVVDGSPVDEGPTLFPPGGAYDPGLLIHLVDFLVGDKVDRAVFSNSGRRVGTTPTSMPYCSRNSST